MSLYLLFYIPFLEFLPENPSSLFLMLSDVVFEAVVAVVAAAVVAVAVVAAVGESLVLEPPDEELLALDPSAEEI